MKIQLIRNATAKVEYASKTFLTDPVFSPKHSLPSFAGLENNPLVDLPVGVEEIVDDIDGVIISHDHPDHFDSVAVSALPGDIPVFCQPDDAEVIERQGFVNVLPLESTINWQGLTLTRVPGRHGLGRMGEMMGQVSGFVFQSESEPTVYWVGDSILCPEVKKNLEDFRPEIIITHSGGAAFPGQEPIIMDGQQTLDTLRASPEAYLVAIHMEALDHCWLQRQALRDLAEASEISSSKLLIPEDGEFISF